MVYIFTIVIGVLIFSRIIYLQFIDDQQWEQKAYDLTEKTLIIEPNRGDICAIDGRLLSTSVPFYEIRMDLKASGITKESFNNNIDSLAYCLHNLFNDKSANEYKVELVNARKRGSRYHLIKRKVSYSQLKKLKTFPLFRLGQNKGGIICIQNDRREKPFIELASRTIGFLYESENGKKDGKVGIESAFNHDLRGVQGIRLMQRLSGNVWMPINSENEVEPKDGNDVFTTIDVNFQDVAETALLKQLNIHGAQYGTVVLMEVETGEIRAIANLAKDSSGVYRETYNYAIGASTEPGSTFKLASLMVALEDGYVNLNDSIETGDGTIKYYDLTLKDSHHGGYGKISVKDVFAFSSNVGISKIITKSYNSNPQRFIDRLSRMNFMDYLNIEIKGEGRPYIKYPTDSNWYGTTLPWMSVGYELKLTPLHILTFYNAVANNGKMVKPMFVKEIKYHGKTIKHFEPEVINSSICSYETIKKAKEALESVVEYGTARNLKNENFKIAGKTGTAQIANLKHGYKSNSKVTYQASFVGYFPADNPKYSCIVVVNSPSNSVYYGNLVAGPVFKEIADKVYATSLEIHPNYGEENNKLIASNPAIKSGYLKDLDALLKELNIKNFKKETSSDWIVVNHYDSIIKIQNRIISDKHIPNVKGMGLKDALFILENAGLKVRVKGKGKVEKQIPDVSSPFRRNDEVTIELS